MISKEEIESILDGVFTDPRFRALSSRLRFGVVDGVKVGVAIANHSANYNNFLLNETDFDRVYDGKTAGKIDLAYVVQAKIDNGNGSVVCDKMDAEKLHRNILATTPPRVGRFGSFWTLMPGFDDDADPF
jgi:hypothetical protein